MKIPSLSRFTKTLFRFVLPFSRAARGAILLACFASGTGSYAIAFADLHASEQDLLGGRADQAIAGLRSAIGREPANGAAHLLLCRTYLSELRGAEAAAECKAALNGGLAGDSTAQDWAGRAFGMQAERAGPIAGLKLAGQVRNAFQTAYRLDPRNPAAANDLGEFYIDAPFIVGGGVDKAAALADSIQPNLPAVAHRLRALMADKRGDPASAEREFQAATQVFQSPGAFVDLACFYVRQKQTEKGVAAARRAVTQDRELDANVVEAASTLGDVHQTAQAVDVLRRYLAHGQQSDQAPAFRVHTLLGELLLKQGDPGSARKEFQQALALAADYAPARKGLESL